MRFRTLSTLVLAGFTLVAGQVGGLRAQAAVPSCAGRDMLKDMVAGSAEAAKSLAAAEAAERNGGAVLWRIEKAGLATSYLLGTIHSTDPRVTTLGAKLTAALGAVDTLAVEIADLSDESMAAAMMDRPDLFVFDGAGLDTRLAEAEFERAAQALGQRQVPRDFATVMRPWLAATSLAIPICEHKRLVSGLDVLDAALIKAAKQRGLEVVGLETTLSQTGVIASIPEPDQLAMLRAAIHYIDHAEDLTETMLAMYLDRRLGAMWEFQMLLSDKVGIARSAYESFREKVLIKRNLGMRDRALPMLAKGRAMIAVGALHLVGDQGLVALLREAGYTVSEIE